MHKCLPKHDTQNDHERSGRKSEQIEGRSWTHLHQSPVIEIVEAEANENDGRGRQDNADDIDLDIWPPLIWFQTETQQEDDA